MFQKRIITIALAIAAFAALNAITAASASASLPLFSPATPQNFTFTSGLSLLENNVTAEKFDCLSDLGTGSITGRYTVGKVVVTFHGCTAINGKEVCPALNKGGKPGLIVVNTLKGELGSTKQSKTGIGVLLGPETGNAFVTLEGGKCATTAEVTGEIAGEVTPVRTLSTEGKNVFEGSAGVQAITEITVLHKVVKPKLVAFAGLVAASENTSETLKFEKAVEVM
jgi:hypothetical protein